MIWKVVCVVLFILVVLLIALLVNDGIHLDLHQHHKIDIGGKKKKRDNEEK